MNQLLIIMKTGLFIILVLVSGCFAGLIHGGINLAIVEPYLDQAIGIENQTLFATGEEEDTPEFWVEYNSYRVWQKGGQVLAGAILGTSIAALVGIVFLFARKVLPQGNNVKKTLVLSGLMWFTIFVIPFLKYPANPPTVGETETVVLRSILFLSFIAISGLSAVGFYQVYKRLQNKKILAFLGYAAFISAVFFIMPENPDEITAPMELVDGFRSASFVAVTVYWLTLGLILGGFIEKLQERLKLKN